MAGNQMIQNREYLLTQFRGCKVDVALYQGVTVFATRHKVVFRPECTLPTCF